MIHDIPMPERRVPPWHGFILNTDIIPDGTSDITLAATLKLLERDSRIHETSSTVDLKARRIRMRLLQHGMLDWANGLPDGPWADRNGLRP
jgi:hypothetical protein